VHCVTVATCAPLQVVLYEVADQQRMRVAGNFIQKKKSCTRVEFTVQSISADRRGMYMILLFSRVRSLGLRQMNFNASATVRRRPSCAGMCVLVRRRQLGVHAQCNFGLAC
jgi:hypothetical protein